MSQKPCPWIRVRGGWDGKEVFYCPIHGTYRDINGTSWVGDLDCIPLEFAAIREIERKESEKSKEVNDGD